MHPLNILISLKYCCLCNKYLTHSEGTPGNTFNLPYSGYGILRFKAHLGRFN